MPDLPLTIEAGGVRVSLDEHALRPLLQFVITDVLERIGADDRIAFSEREAAERLGVPRHVLRDARLRGEIQAKKLGRGWHYSRAVLLRFLTEEE